MLTLVTLLLIQSVQLFLVRFVLTSTILLGAGLLACRLMRKSSSADRHAVLATSLVAALFAPLLTGALPSLSVFRDLIPGETFSLLVPTRVEPAGTRVMDLVSTGGASGIAVPWFLREPSLYMLPITLVWPFGLLIFGARLLMGRNATARLRRLPSLPDGSARAMAARIIGRSGIRRTILLVTSTLPTAVTAGITMPIVALPADAVRWTPGRLHRTMQHELAHVKRLDVLWQVVAHLVRATLWFHPLAWIAARKLSAESEGACDDAVVNSGVRPSLYAQELLQIADDAAHSPLHPYSFAIGMSYGPGVDIRVRQLLQEGNNHAPRCRRLQYCAAAFALVLLVPFGSGVYLGGDFRPAEESEQIDMVPTKLEINASTSSDLVGENGFPPRLSPG